MSQRDYFEKDYYAALGVGKGATQAEIGKVYRTLARQLHPDARPGDAEAETRFKEVSEAYSVLSNTDKRAEYDKVRDLVGSGAFRGGLRGGGFGGGGFPGGAQGEAFDLNDLLGGLFSQGGAGSRRGGGAGQRGARQGRDVETEMTIGFADAMAGVTTTLRIAGPAPCETCSGTGAAPGTTPVRCRTCDGAGVVSDNQGLFSFSQPCPTCHGSGTEVTTPCPTCAGTGTQRRTREITARIPAGVRDGARVRLAGKGEAGPHGTPAGDLFVVVHVEDHPQFGRRGDHLTLRVPITFAEAVLGAKITVPTLDAPVTLKVPAGTQPGRTFRVKGKGIRAAGRKAGDLLVTVDVAIPQTLSRQQRKLVEQLRTADGDGVRDHLRTETV